MSDKIQKLIPEDLPRVGDVVSCHFPLAEDPDQPGPKARPGLVVSVSRGADPSAPSVVEVVYGTSRPKHAAGRWLRIRRTIDLRIAGLHRPTLFMFGKAARLPFTRAYFRCNSHGVCRLGRVPEGLMRYVRDGLPEFNERGLRLSHTDRQAVA